VGRPAFLYRPYTQGAPADATLIVRSGSMPASMGGTLPREMAAIDPDVPLSNVQTVREWIPKTLSYPQFRATVLSGFALVALLLALVGLYDARALRRGARDRGAARGTGRSDHGPSAGLALTTSSRTNTPTIRLGSARWTTGADGRPPSSRSAVSIDWSG